MGGYLTHVSADCWGKVKEDNFRAEFSAEEKEGVGLVSNWDSLGRGGAGGTEFGQIPLQWEKGKKMIADLH